MEKENNVVIKQVVIPESCNRGSSTHLLFCNETTNDKRGRFPSPSRTGKLGNDANFMSRCFDGGGFTPALVIPVLAARAKAGYSAGYKCGFTLIELLVVVLIIGILAAVALPQYQKAVEKSKAVQALTMLKSVYQAGKAYELSTGSWPTKFDELAVDIPWSGTTRVSMQNCISDVRSNADWSLHICNGVGNSPALYMIRLSGKYATQVSFNIYFGKQDVVPTDKIICWESNANVSPAGSYCEQLFKGKFQLGTSREYVLP